MATTPTNNDLATFAINALTEINRRTKAWRDNCKANGYAAHFKEAPAIADHLHIELLEAICAFDEAPVGSLAELRFQDEMADERARELGVAA